MDKAGRVELLLLGPTQLCSQVADSGSGGGGGWGAVAARLCSVSSAVIQASMPTAESVGLLTEDAEVA